MLTLYKDDACETPILIGTGFNPLVEGTILTKDQYDAMDLSNLPTAEEMYQGIMAVAAYGLAFGDLQTLQIQLVFTPDLGFDRDDIRKAALIAINWPSYPFATDNQMSLYVGGTGSSSYIPFGIPSLVATLLLLAATCFCCFGLFWDIAEQINSIFKMASGKVQTLRNRMRNRMQSSVPTIPGPGPGPGPGTESQSESGATTGSHVEYFSFPTRDIVETDYHSPRI